MASTSTRAQRGGRAPVRERHGTPRHTGQLQRLDVDQLSPADAPREGLPRARRTAHSNGAVRLSREATGAWVDHRRGSHAARLGLSPQPHRSHRPSPCALRFRWSLRTDDPETIRRGAIRRRGYVAVGRSDHRERGRCSVFPVCPISGSDSERRPARPDRARALTQVATRFLRRTSGACARAYIRIAGDAGDVRG